ncbi:MAG: hypothetical protein DVB31_16735, partial [Verrucomicrobia bacterium]
DTLSVLNDDTTHLGLSVAPDRLVEGGSAVATVTRAPAGASALVVQIISADPAQLGTPGTVTIPAGLASATFAVVAVEDTLVERTNTYTLTVTAPGHPDAAASVTIEDNDVPNVVLALAAHTVSEGAGANATSATVTRSPVSNRAVTVALVSSDPTVAKVPATVVIPAGQAGASVPVAAVNNLVVDGSRAVTIGGNVLDSVNGTPVREIAPDLLHVTDDDGPTLSLKVADDVVPEGRNPATTATVTRNTPTTSALVVSLLSSATAEATVPATVTIPAGAASAQFPVVSVNDGVTDGNKTVALTATAAGFTAGNAILVVSDADLPDLVVTAITAPATGIAGGQLTATFRVENRGVVAAAVPVGQRVFLSTDNVVGGDLLVAQLQSPGSLPAGQYFEQTVNIRLPDQTGNYWIVVTTDANNDVAELLENNNTRIGNDPVVVGPAYTATVETDVTTALAGTAIPLHGSATRAGSGLPAANAPVTVHLMVRGIARTLSVLTGIDGQFDTTFRPLPGEAGHYRVAAAYPGQPMPPAQDEFTLLGFSIGAVGTVTVVEGTSVGGTTQIDNLSEVPLTGMAVSVVAHHPSIAVTASLAGTTLGGDGSLALAFGITAVDTSAAQSSVQLRVTSTEGVVVDLLFNVRQERLMPRLVANPANLATTMRRGAQTTVTFDVANNGGRDTGPLDVIPPSLPWLSLASVPRLDSLRPGSNTTVTVLLTPPADMAFGDYHGTLVLQSANANLAVPYSFRPISENKGSILVVAEDEYTYFAAGSPRVANATVVISDALTGTPVSTNHTDIDGKVLVANLNEAFYIVDVRADAHGKFRESTLVVAGQTATITAFLTRETVRYSFTVVPTTVEDHYTFVVESIFETQVPVPVVTIEPSSIDLGQYSGDEFQFDVTVSNHGLINAQDVRLDIPSTPRLQITPLVSNIGKLPANSSLTIPVLVRRLPPPGEHRPVRRRPARQLSRRPMFRHRPDALGLPVRTQRGRQEHGLLCLRFDGLRPRQTVQTGLRRRAGCPGPGLHLLRRSGAVEHRHRLRGPARLPLRVQGHAARVQRPCLPLRGDARRRQRGVCPGQTLAQPGRRAGPRCLQGHAPTRKRDRQPAPERPRHPQRQERQRRTRDPAVRHPRSHPRRVHHRRRHRFPRWQVDRDRGLDPLAVARCRAPDRFRVLPRGRHHELRPGRGPDHHPARPRPHPGLSATRTRRALFPRPRRVLRRPLHARGRAQHSLLARHAGPERRLWRRTVPENHRRQTADRREREGSPHRVQAGRHPTGKCRGHAVARRGFRRDRARDKQDRPLDLHLERPGQLHEFHREFHPHRCARDQASLVGPFHRDPRAQPHRERRPGL